MLVPFVVRAAGLLFLAGAAVAGAQTEPAVVTPEAEAEECLACHSDETLTREVDDGSSVPLFVDGEKLAHSVHGGKVRCTGCHQGMAEIPHPERKYASKAAFHASFLETCKSCHFETYTKLVDSMHYRVLARGDARAPSCVECHGSHEIRARTGEPRIQVSQTCGKCHEGVQAAYAASVHGRALGQGNPDVPACTDCHRAHDVGGPQDPKWLLSSPQTCGHCHSDEKRMAKYGLSTNVLRTYLADFHGTTATLALGGHAGDGRVTALCTDCHGVHDIAKVDAPGSHVLKANVAATCQRCHPDAADTFPAAWLSHFEPSWSNAPVVYGANLFYSFLIPFMIGGLAVHVLLHLWHAARSR
jgi:hypothetical protein